MIYLERAEHMSVQSVVLLVMLLTPNLLHQTAKFDKFENEFRLIDTAGIRRRAVVALSGSTTEALSINRAFRVVRRSDVVALVIEAMACITEQVICLQLLCR